MTPRIEPAKRASRLASSSLQQSGTPACICTSAGFFSSRTPRPRRGAAQNVRDMNSSALLATAWNDSRLSRTGSKFRVHRSAARDGVKSP